MSSRAEVPHHHVLINRRHNSTEGTLYLSALSLEDFCEISEQSLDLEFLDREEAIAANDCRGLLCFQQENGTIFLCNPTTKQVRSFHLETAKSLVSGALGYDSKSDDYKLVRISVEEFDIMYAEVYSLKSDKKWRKITSVPPNYPPMTDSSIYVDATGKSYWLAWDYTVLSFDFGSEEFANFRLPEIPFYHCPIGHVLVKLHDGFLGVVRFWPRVSLGESWDCHFVPNTPGYYYELWGWDEEKKKWYKMFDVCLCGGAGKPIGLHGRFLFLASARDSSDRDAEHHMLVYDWTTKKCLNPHTYIYDYSSAAVISYAEETTDVQGNPIQPQLPSPPQTTTTSDVQMSRCDKDVDTYACKEIAAEWVKDRLANGFRVVEDDHPSKVCHVIVPLKKRDCDSTADRYTDTDDDDYTDWFRDEVKVERLTIDGDSQGEEELVDDDFSCTAKGDRKRKREITDVDAVNQEMIK